MADDTRSLRSVYVEAEQKRTAIESSAYSNSSAFQENLLAAIHLYEECVNIADRIALFSRNESLEDIATADLAFLLLNYHIAELILRINGPPTPAIIDDVTSPSSQSYIDSPQARCDNKPLLQVNTATDPSLLTPPASDAGASSDSGKEDEQKDRELFSAVEKPRIRYDVEVITKLVVYAGIAWWAVEGNPLLFRWVGVA
ncbi:hypothetical protein B0A55_13728 [Friedmanniomyces simplex]|uniref:Uncharacterized protein n=1 Tax=Friedmanniomyces simplex TaxID=329884 RepID=A0A4U0V5E1_9PEZI|nr:hypothetical protein B0A55_13728 [Friedmanniomyces simplex]